jgi:uncharacterized membrane protein YeaQ/YmgE (transglycosylase-associated protein family)
MWVLAGGIAGWVGFKFIGANENHGMMISIFIGVVGGFFGGNVLAPMFGGAAPVQGAINTFALVMAAIAAVTCLFIGEMLARRFDI